MSATALSRLRRCPCCGQDKAEVEFGANRAARDGRNCYCRECANKKAAVRRERMRGGPPAIPRCASPEEATERRLAAQRRYREANKDKARAYAEANQGRALAHKRAWAERNREKVRAAKAERYRRDGRFRLNHTISCGIAKSIRGGKGQSWRALVDFTFDELLVHIERQFLDGMSWDNYGNWHIDHIMPLSSFSISHSNDPELKRAWALTNLRPLWARDNLRKNAKVLTLL